MFKKNFIDKELVSDHLKKIDLTFNQDLIKADKTLFNKTEGRV
jgi:hypothetical protein